MSAADVTERDVERAFAEHGRRLGAEVLKLTSPGNAGVPDRLVLFPDGTHALVELKAPGKRPRPLQQRVFSRLAAQGHPVTVVDSKAGAQLFWARNRWRFGRGEAR
ncbi:MULTISPECIES: VRR-NUC domain-containing protein [Gordonibacter]|uniref:Nuclease n=1 Tax=Siphoviridae sp. ctZi05 TaxID=2826385 RepID=A0A8S5N1D6_9CAUD|nr:MULTISPECIES: VRR-NUC domain-containing protein [Gordonibacter]MCB7085240.1 VRR-NUC domain-containing protein [Gordonibacter urolithinfaciens]DAD87947.1 MAG TPA: Nuclease [Siphoviridae sp. ctZi05]